MGSGWSMSSPPTGSTSRWPAGCWTCRGRATTSGGTGRRQRAPSPTPSWPTDRRRARRLPRDLRRAAGARRAAARAGHPLRPQAGRPADAPGRLPGSATARKTNRRRPAPAVHDDLVRAGSSPMPRTGSGSPTSPNTPPRGQGLLLRRAGRVLPPHRRLVDRRPPARRARRRRPGDGPLAAPARPGTDRALRPRLAIHLLGVRAPAARRRPARLDGPGRLQRGQRDDRVVLVTMQRELLDTRRWATPADWLGDLRVDRGLVQPPPPPLRPRHARPAAYEYAPQATLPTAAEPRHDHHTTRVRRTGSGSSAVQARSRAGVWAD